MRFDKLTTKFQQAFADAQSLALGNDNGFIEPQHLLAALLAQEDGGTTSLLARAGVQVPKMQVALKNSIENLPKVEGQGGEISVGRDLNNLLNLTDKEATKRGDQFIASELFLLALTGRDGKDGGDTGRLAKDAGLNRKALEAAIDAVRGGGGVNSQEAEGQRQSLAKYTIELAFAGTLGQVDRVLGQRRALAFGFLRIDATAAAHGVDGRFQRLAVQARVLREAAGVALVARQRQQE